MYNSNGNNKAYNSDSSNRVYLRGKPVREVLCIYEMPVGGDSFREVVEEKYYFVDKTNFIKELRSSDDVEDMLQSMLVGAAEDFEMNLEQILRNYVSYNDAASGESFYHGMMLGFFVLLNNTYVVESNRESGYGRFELALLPYDCQQWGVILEFKRNADEVQLENKAREALAQIEDLSYIAEFDKRGIKKVWKYGVAFCGRKVCLRGNE